MDLSAFLDSTAGLALKGAIVAAFLDFGIGVIQAFRLGAFSLENVAAFLRKHLLGRVVPLSLLLIAGYVTGDEVMNGFAAAGLVAYAAETMKSVYDSFTETKAEAIATAPTE